MVSSPCILCYHNFKKALIFRAVMLKKDLSSAICKPFCNFFREGEKEEMACQGVRALSALIIQGRVQPSDWRSWKKPSRKWIDDAEINSALCEHCDFKSDGCDFKSSTPPPDAEPCGGYILYALLKEKGKLP